VLNLKVFLRAGVFAAAVVAYAFGQGTTGGEPRPHRVHDAAPKSSAQLAGEAAIRAGVAELQKAIDARDAEKCAALYAADAEIFPPGVPVITTVAARLQFWKEFLADAAVKTTIDPPRVEVARSGELGYESGAFTEAAKDSQGKTKAVKGKNVVVWKKQPDGTWKIAADIFNEDK
jgi:ketosteroid isomerase-like protein